MAPDGRRSPFKQPPLAQPPPVAQTDDPGQQSWGAAVSSAPHSASLCRPDRPPAFGSSHARGALRSERATQVSPAFQGPLRVFSAPTPTAALPGCEGLLDTGSGFPTLVSVTGSTFCPRIGFLGFCLFSVPGVFEGDFLSLN